MITFGQGNTERGSVRFELNKEEMRVVSLGDDNFGDNISIAVKNGRAGSYWRIESGRAEVRLTRQGAEDRIITVTRGVLIRKLAGDQVGPNGEVEKGISFVNPAQRELGLEISIRNKER